MPIDHAGERTSPVEFVGLQFDRLGLQQVVSALASNPPDRSFSYLVTPNVDHVVRLSELTEPDRGRIWAAYRGADLCVCDSRILARLAAVRGVRLPVAPGSDLIAELFSNGLLEGQSVAIVGGTQRSLKDLREKFPAIVFHHHIPPMGLRHDQAALEAAAAFVAQAGARFTILAVGSPQQELLAALIKARGQARGFGLCVGASIEFITGEKKRAPRWVRTLHLEWAHRLATDPKRLWRRYLIDGPKVFAIARKWRPDRLRPARPADRRHI